MSGPPKPDPSHIETRLLIVAEMLERAVTEVRRAMDEIKSDTAVSVTVEVGDKTTKAEITYPTATPPTELGSADVH